jgi:3-hydroxyisobutyrate dehydrogenase-like beta-hydroxyacid dehydrogenase
VKERIGLVGVGIMGVPIAQALIDHGYDVVAFDKSDAAMSRARSFGCTGVATPAAVARYAEVVLISLPRPEHVTEVVRDGNDCLLSGAQPGSVVVDTSTVDPATSQRNAAAAADIGVGYVDSPILGRPSGCGIWTLAAGGEAAHIAAVMPVLEVFAARVVHVGPSGQGNVLKLMNNLMFGAINTITCEVFALGERLGMEPALFFDTISESGAATVSNLFKELGPKIVNRDFSPNFSVDNLEKDVGLGLSMARQNGMTLEFSEAGQRLTQAAQAIGLGPEDTAAVVRLFANEELTE